MVVHPLDLSEPVSNDDRGGALTSVVAANLRRIRTQRGLSLQRLADKSGVSRAMLGQIELAKSAPTVNVLWKIARALDVSMSVLICDRSAQTGVVPALDASKTVYSGDSAVSVRPLFPSRSRRCVEFHEMRIRPNACERHDAHPAGTMENLVVALGAVEIEVGKNVHRLLEADAILFDADEAHRYHNRGDVPAVLYIVTTYADPR